MHSATCYFWWLSYSRLHTPPFTVFCIDRVIKVQLRSCKACVWLHTVLWMCYQSFEKNYILTSILLHYYLILVLYFALLGLYRSNYEAVKHMIMYSTLNVLPKFWKKNLFLLAYYCIITWFWCRYAVIPCILPRNPAFPAHLLFLFAAVSNIISSAYLFSNPMQYI